MAAEGLAIAGSRFMSRSARWCLPIMLCGLSACGDGRESVVVPARVKVQAVTMTAFAPQINLTGSVQAGVQSDLSFRVGGKLVELYVDVGDSVKAGQLLARLDPQEQHNIIAAAEAAVLAERTRLQQSEADWRRQSLLLPKGYTSRSEYDLAKAALRSAESTLRAAEAQLASAREQLAHTCLISEADGVITSRTVEVGQVVQAVAPVFGLALDGPRDAVFHIYEALFNQAFDELEDIEVEVVRLDDPRIRSRGRVREVTPTVSERSGTLQVKVALIDQPEGMELGSVVTARQAIGAHDRVLLPASALSSLAGEAAVWVVEAGMRVALRPVRVVRYSDGLLVLDAGLELGQQVVVAGGQLLYPGQLVEIAEVLQAPPALPAEGEAG